MAEHFTVVDGKSIRIGNDPDYDYVRDYRKAQAFTHQEVTCGKCHGKMKPEGRVLSPLYGTTCEHFRCEPCGIEVYVSPLVEGGKR